MTCSPQAGGTAGHVPPSIDFEASAAHLVGGIDELHPFVRDGQDYGWDLLHVLRGFLQKEEHSSEQSRMDGLLPAHPRDSQAHAAGFRDLGPGGGKLAPGRSRGEGTET